MILVLVIWKYHKITFTFINGDWWHMFRYTFNSCWNIISVLVIQQYRNITFTFASGGLRSASRWLTIGEKSPLRYHFLLVNKVRSLSLSIGEIWPTQLYSLSLKYDPPHFHFLWVKYGPDNYFYFHQRWNMICSIALSKVSTVPCRSYDVRAFWQCTAVQVPNFHCEGFVYIYQCWL